MTTNPRPTFVEEHDITHHTTMYLKTAQDSYRKANTISSSPIRYLHRTKNQAEVGLVNQITSIPENINMNKE